MIEVKIREFAEKRGITTAYQLRKALEVSPTVAARLWRGNFAMLGMDTLDKLCRVLRCQPDKLLKYIPSTE
jgi:DNA-binding Xre family transcriptional regulator